MIQKLTSERCVYLLLVILSVVAAWISISAPSYFTDNSVVYQGF